MWKLDRLCAAFCATWLLLIGIPRADAAGAAARGKVVFALAAGCGCHTPKDGPVGAGGGEVPTPFGTFYGTNITPDPETGIGAWTDAEIGAAIREGIARGSGVESPAMPYSQYAGMADDDVADLIAYLRSLPPVRRANRPFQGELPLARWAYRAWRLLFFRPPPRLAHAPNAGVERGHYLVDHVAVCGDCHTPRTRLGVPDSAMYLAGSAHGLNGKPIPNITPHRTGIGGWGVDDIVNVLTLGMLPNLDNVQGFMADVVDGHGGGPGLKDAPESDRRAIADYLVTIPPIDNTVDAK
ncbi:MAG: c-type cytochrome [Candidatus Binatia bacterium]